MGPELEYALRLVVLFVAAVWAGAQNQLAGGGSFLTLPALMLTGMDARAANITSTVALFPGQITGGLMARHMTGGLEWLSFRALVIISLIGAGWARYCCFSRPALSSNNWCPGWFCLPRWRLPGAASGGSQRRVHIISGPRAIAPCWVICNNWAGRLVGC